MAMLSHRLRRVLIAAPSYFQRSYSLSRPSNFTSVSSLLHRSVVVKQSTEFNQSPARFLSTTQYQYDPYTGEDSFTPDNEGCDFNHWLITMNFPKDNIPSREEMISIFEQTCAKGLCISLEEAKKKIYAICTTSYQGFQAIMSVGEVEKFRELPGVQYIIPDSYVDVENKVYGGDKYENGVITPGPVPVPTKEGFDSVEKESTPRQELVQIVETLPDQSPTSDRGNQTPLDRRSFNQRQETLALGQGQSRGQGKGQGSQMQLYQRSFKQGQGVPIHGQRKTLGSEVSSFQGSLKQAQESGLIRQGQGQGSQMTSVHGGNNQSQGTPIHGQGYGQGHGSQIPSYRVGYSQGQGLPSNYGQGALANYNQGSSPQGNFIKGTQENYNQMGQGNYTQQSGGNYGSAQGAGSQGGQIPSYQMSYSQGLGAPVPPYQGNYIQGTPNSYGQWALANYNQMGQGNYTQQSGGNYGPAQGPGSPGFGHGQGQGGQIPSYQMSYSQGLGAPVPPYQGNYIQGTPNSYGQWAFVNYNQGPPHGNSLQGPPQNYNQGGPQNGGYYGPAQFGQWYPGTPQGQGNQIPQYQLSYNQGQGTPFPGQWRCQGCGMLSYQVSYNQGQGIPNSGQWQGQGCAMPSYQASYNQDQGAQAPPYHGNYNQGTLGSYGQGTSANFNQGFPMNQANDNMQNSGNYGPAHGSAGNPGFVQGLHGHGQNQTFPQEDQRNVAGDGRNNNNPADSIETRKRNSRT